LARQQAGCTAQDAALAIEEARLRRFNLQLQSGLNVREQVKAIEIELQRQLPWRLADTVWDFHGLAKPEKPALAEPHQRPDWLVAAMQAQAVQHVEVLATQRAWVAACEDWCRAAGLWLVRLEPAWQAEQRWQRLPQPSSQTATQVLAPHVQAQVGGLALGVFTP
jgi:Tfp pilus assembly PilM family ATPase